MTKHFYEKNDYLLNHPVNKSFDEILWMTDEEFREWVRDMRQAVKNAWDVHGCPPRVGLSEDQIQNQFRKLAAEPVQFEVEPGVIRNTKTNLGTAVNSWFPTMMKTRINNPSAGPTTFKGYKDGISIYDYFAQPEFYDKCCTYAHRHFKRDSFYHYSRPIRVGETFDLGGTLHIVNDFNDFLHTYNNLLAFNHNVWFKKVKDDLEYTGFNESLKDKKWISVSKEDLQRAFDVDLIDEMSLVNVDMEDGKIVDESNFFRIMVFELGQKVFPLGFKPFRISWSQYATNFPPLTAKHLYQRFCRNFRNQDRIIVYDPSMGWAGRLLGALSCSDSYNIHYVGTDPNQDHTIEPGYTKYHDIAKYYNGVRNERSLFPHENTCHIFQVGSEEISNHPDFLPYKGKLDLAFTSPPYFNREGYSDDPEQSYKKFPQYDEWVEGFMRPTLQTCWDWLKSDRYLLWNISDLKIGKGFLPLVDDSIRICEEIGFEHQDTLKMIMAQMPGGNRLDPETGEPTAKYSVQVNGMWFKYEPILVFYKPEI